MGLLYSNMKIFHYKEKIDSLVLSREKITAPLHIRIKPTNVCNHNCWYCGYRRKNIQLGKDMSIKDHIPGPKMAEMVEDFILMGVKAVTFSGGGEPLCYPDLADALLKLSGGGIKFACLTNGSMLKGKIAELFAHEGSWVRVSMDGWDSASYSAYRNVGPEEFGKVIKNLENFALIGGPCRLGVSIIVDKENAYHVRGMISRLINIGIQSIKVAPCLVSNDKDESNEYHRPYLDIVSDQVKSAISDSAESNVEIFNSYKEQLATFKKSYSWCPYIQINPVIGADLNVYACHDKAYNIEGGKIFSIKNQRFIEGWFSDKSMFFRINPSKDCPHHCAVDKKNKMILEYMDVDPEHVEFV